MERHDDIDVVRERAGDAVAGTHAERRQRVRGAVREPVDVGVAEPSRARDEELPIGVVGEDPVEDLGRPCAGSGRASSCGENYRTRSRVARVSERSVLAGASGASGYPAVASVRSGGGDEHAGRASPSSEAEGIGALTIGGFTEEVCARFAANEALVFDDPLRGGETVRWTYADLRDQARRVAKALIAAGLGKGARVGVLMGNRPEAVAALLGAPMAGAVAVPLSTFSPMPELEYLAASRRHLGAAHPDPPARPQLRRRRRRARPCRVPVPRARRAAVGDPSWDEFLATGDAVDDAALDGRIGEVHESDHGLIIYSSGTTDRPKGMLHTNRAPDPAVLVPAQVFGRHEGTRMWTRAARSSGRPASTPRWARRSPADGAG